MNLFPYLVLPCSLRLLPLKPKNPLPLRSPVLVKFAYKDPSKLRLKLNEPFLLPPNAGSEEIDEDSDRGNEDEEEQANVIVSSSPPKDALLLMRSRSAPYRAYSLANHFWGAPSPIEDVANGKKEQKDGEEEQERPTSEKEIISRDSTVESRFPRFYF
ncbi:hypothetical protein NE237_002827 [Protea cynaroides]|uniref:Uncharacterized protein n=1 Tax=Protea cynaroides TaxID=273540 RepID=A0A9Q0KFQ5_9MAGN|nr:hypothetical protein NE237_002827 [Protea cynaroides]